MDCENPANAARNWRTVEVAEELDIPAGFLWRTLSDFEHIDRWANVKVRLIDGSGIGCTRTVEMESGAVVTERLLICDHERRVFCYQVVPPNPYRLADYRSTVAIEKISAHRSRLSWTGIYVPAESCDPIKTDRFLHKVYRNGIELLRQHYARQ
jgi:hypothetical protein